MESNISKSFVLKKLVVLDRDGVVNVKPVPPSRYILEKSAIKFNSDVIAWIARISKRLPVCVATNQQGVGKKLLSRKNLDEIHSRINLEIRCQGGEELHYFVCPHLESENCLCRKPKPGLLIAALDHFNVEAQDAIFVGDSESDSRAAEVLQVDYLDVEELRWRIKENPNFPFNFEK